VSPRGTRKARLCGLFSCAQRPGNSGHTGDCKGNDEFSFPLTFPRSRELALRLAFCPKLSGLENRFRLVPAVPSTKNGLVRSMQSDSRQRRT
jgi:hypothetical protein